MNSRNKKVSKVRTSGEWVEARVCRVSGAGEECSFESGFRDALDAVDSSGEVAFEGIGFASVKGDEHDIRKELRCGWFRGGHESESAFDVAPPVGRCILRQ
jgi:hypothetical protein